MLKLQSTVSAIRARKTASKVDSRKMIKNVKCRENLIENYYTSYVFFFLLIRIQRILFFFLSSYVSSYTSGLCVDLTGILRFSYFCSKSFGIQVFSFYSEASKIFECKIATRKRKFSFLNTKKPVECEYFIKGIE